jgi:23S rRNA (adenine2503-C2)-methyltransferase
MEIDRKKQDLLDYDREMLVQWFADRSLAAYRADQVMKWIYIRGENDFDRMTDLSKAIRAMLADHFVVGHLHHDREMVSEDGSRKYRLRLSDGALIESVLMPERNHSTLCVSSQVGCALGCRFCMTGAGGLVRNLTRAEIVGQVRELRPKADTERPLTNLVFMGMGEPLANFDALISALSTLTDNDFGLKFSGQRITVSTAGLVPQMALLGKKTRVNLAVSLNATDDDTRSRLMPINRKYPIETLLAACRDYPLPKGRRITFKYILIAGVNDSLAEARRLAKLLRPIRAKINLIPFNPHPGSEFQRPDEAAVLAFQKILIDSHYTAIIRRSKGQDIAAACGQLAAEGQNGG